MSELFIVAAERDDERRNGEDEKEDNKNKESEGGEKSGDEEEKRSAAKLAVRGFSRVVTQSAVNRKDKRDRRNGETREEEEENGNEEESEGVREEEGDDEFKDEQYYTEEEERHFGAEREEFDERKMTLWEIPLTESILKRYEFLRELPEGVAVMGGVARSVAREIITGEREPIRDIDLVNILSQDGKSEVSPEKLTELSKKFMPDDFAFGHGIGNDTIENYFRTRDFTINQSLIKDGKLIVSDLAYNDFSENIIRPSYFEHSHENDEIGSRLFLKALMLRGVVTQISSSVPTIEDMKEPDEIRMFDVALFLNKAMSRGAQTARAFTRDLVEWGIIREEFSDRPVALAKVLTGEVYSFEFRPNGDENFLEIPEMDDMDGYFPPREMTEFHASSPEIKRAIEEYEDWQSRESEKRVGNERRRGRYTEAEYDEINRAGGWN